MPTEFLLFIGKKFLSCILALWVIITLTFFLMKAAPGDPLTQEQAFDKNIYENLRQYYGLEKPLFEQYTVYLSNIFTFNMGPSLVHTGRTATQIIKDTFPVSGLLGAEALVLAAFFGLLSGITAAIWKEKKISTCILLGTILLLSIPNFILGAFLQYFFGVYLEWLPIARWDTLTHTLLPAIALAAMPGAFLVKLIKTNMTHVMQQDYIQFARAKGLSSQRIVWKHALKNALVPLLGYFGKMSANIIVGSFVIEKIFCIPGLGYWFVSSIGSRDYPIIMGLTIFYSVILLTMLFVADLLHTMMDSRIYRKRESLVS